MDSRDIRARIAEMEDARASGEQPADGPQRVGHGGSGEDDSWPWAFLFEGSLASAENSSPEGFAWEQWLSEGLSGFQKLLRGMGPDKEFWLHVRAAERELLLAMRVLIEARLRRFEEQANEEATRSPGLEHIEVEFE